MSTPDNEIFADELSFEQLWQAIQAGDSSAQAVAVEKIMPKMLECVQRRFASCATFEPEDAVASAVRTIQRRQWMLTKGRGDDAVPIEPRDWGDLVGLLVVFALNKARTHRKKRVMPQLPAERGADGEARDWHPADEAEAASEIVMQQELRTELQAVVARLAGSMSEMNQIILRGKLDGLSTKEICDQLRESGIHRVEASVRTAWRTKILPDLRQMFDPNSD